MNKFLFFYFDIVSVSFVAGFIFILIWHWTWYSGFFTLLFRWLGASESERDAMIFVSCLTFFDNFACKYHVYDGLYRTWSLYGLTRSPRNWMW